MKVSEFIQRLKDLQDIAGDVTVTVPVGYISYGEAVAEIYNVVPSAKERWKCLSEGNTHQIVVVW